MNDLYYLAWSAAQARADAAEEAQVAIVTHRLGQGGRGALRAASEAANDYLRLYNRLRQALDHA